jgi:hypothetical protein
MTRLWIWKRRALSICKPAYVTSAEAGHLPGLAEALLLVFAPVRRLAQFLVGGLSVNKKKKMLCYLWYLVSYPKETVFRSRLVKITAVLDTKTYKTTGKIICIYADYIKQYRTCVPALNMQNYVGLLAK